MHLSPPVAKAAVHSKVVVLLLLSWFLIVTSIVGFCNCSMFCCALLYVHSIFAIILMGKRELVALLSLSTWCLMIVVWLFHVVPQACLQFVIVVFPDNTSFLILNRTNTLIMLMDKYEERGLQYRMVAYNYYMERRSFIVINLD